MNPVLELIGIAKRFGAVAALDGVDFRLEQGQIHGLLGENGAGKSTLMRLAFGLGSPDRGTIRVRGQVVSIRSPDAAKRLGIGMVHQHFTSIPALTVQENLWLAAGRQGSAAGRPPGSADESTIATRLRTRLWEGIDPGTRAGDLSVSGKQRLEILQALATGAEILLLDEPTAVLTPSEVTELLALLRQFAVDGGSVVFITHKLNEVVAAVDRITVLRHGQVRFSGDAKGETAETLARAMVGGDNLEGPNGPEASEVVDGTILVAEGALEVRGGEIVGIAAVEGNGQRELMLSVAGIGSRPRSMRVAEPVALIPEDRTTEGLVPGFTLTENLVLGLPTDRRWSRGPWINWRAANDRMAELIDEFEIRAPGPSVPVRSLSGGNQQKVVFARALEAHPRVVVAENPTRGLDVQATGFVHAQLRQLAGHGAAVLVHSADLDEVLALSHRVVVMYRGRLTTVPTGASRERIGEMMLGVGW